MIEQALDILYEPWLWYIRAQTPIRMTCYIIIMFFFAAWGVTAYHAGQSLRASLKLSVSFVMMVALIRLYSTDLRWQYCLLTPALILLTGIALALLIRLRNT